MYFEINISLNGQHFFATAKRSITSINDLDKVYKEIKKRFLPKDGFKITVTKYEEIGRSVEGFEN